MSAIQPHPLTSIAVDVRDAALDGLDPRTLYRILALRSQVFVVEQDCVYLDLDGRDGEPGARMLWVEHGDAVVATLRLLLDDARTLRIGRVATSPAARGAGLAAALMRRALELAAGREVVLAPSPTSRPGTPASASSAMAKSSSRTGSRTSRCAGPRP
jgi:predicted GNAT family N-acyltransferase